MKNLWMLSLFLKVTLFKRLNFVSIPGLLCFFFGLFDIMIRLITEGPDETIMPLKSSELNRIKCVVMHEVIFLPTVF